MEAPKHIFIKAVTFLSVQISSTVLQGSEMKKKISLKFMDGMTKRKLFNVSAHEVSLLSVSLH